MSTEPRIIPSTCWECSTTCGSLLTVEQGRVTKVGPNAAHPGSKGAFCAKGIRALPEWTYGKQRLLHPLRRQGPRGSAEWQRITWEEALAEIATGLAAAAGRYGPLALAGAVSGGYFSRGAIVALLMRALGSPNWLINQDLCGGCRGVSDRVTGLGIANGEDIDNAASALVVGRNPYAADPVQWRALTALKKRGGKIVVIDPSETPIARRADLWLRPRPGTDAAIALAMIEVVIKEQRFDAEFVHKWCEGFEALAERASAFPPDRAARIADVPVEDIVAAARIYSDGPSVFVSGHGIDAFSSGFQTFRAFHCLLAICGQLDRPGGNRRVRRPPGFKNYLDLIHSPRFQLPTEVAQRTLGATKYPFWAGPRGWQTACHNPTVIEAILTGEPYPLRAMYVSGVNIAVTYPDPRRTVAALKSLDFLAVAAHEHNPTTAWADIVLPKTTTLEEEEVQLQPGAPCVSYTQPAHAPLGEARCDMEIAAGILGAAEPLMPVNRKLLPWSNQREFNAYLLADSDIDLQVLREQGYAQFASMAGDFDTAGFATPSGKVELYSEALQTIGQDPLPGFGPPSAPKDADSAYPLILLTGARDKNYHHSRFRSQAWLRKQLPYPRLTVHPETAEKLALQDQAWVEIETHRTTGSARAKVEISDRVLPGVVSTGMGWWLPEAGGPDFGNGAVNINNALAYAAPFDPVAGSADTRGIPCRVRPA